MKTRLSEHWVEAAVLGVVSIVVLFTVAATVLTSQTSGDIEDLSYSATMRELTGLMGRAGRDQLAELEPRQLPVGSGIVPVTFIRPIASELLEPALAKGGFIADQIDQFNNYAVRAAVEEEFLGIAAGGEALSVWKTESREDGTTRLASTPNSSVLTVRSPWAERQWREVRASDWHRGGGLLGISGGVGVPGATLDGGIIRLNGKECTVQARQEKTRLLYCTSTLASSAGAFFDLGFDLDESALGLERVYPSRERDIWVNGERRRLRERERGTTVAGGDVLDYEKTGAMAISLADHGSIAARQWINGRQAVTTTDAMTLGFFGMAGRVSSLVPAPLMLSLDAALSADLESESQRFMASLGTGLRRAVVVVMDARTGEIRAIVEPTRKNRLDALAAFEPVLVGSVAKPMVAGAILAHRPDLLGLTVASKASPVDVVAGVALSKGFATPSGCAAQIDAVEFLRCSSNQFAAELLVRSLNLSPGTTLVPRQTLEGSALGTGLADVFDVDAFAGRTSGRTSALWSIGTARGLWPWESRPWILFPSTEGTPTDWVARYAFGGWENRWTLLGVAEAYARIATGRALKASLEPSAPSAEAPAPLHANALRALAQIRRGLELVGNDGTARGLTATLTASLPKGTVVFSKTGTLNEDSDRFKALALVVGRPETPAPGSALSCGLVAVTYFEFPAARRRTQSTPLPPVHLSFARNHLSTVLNRHWARLNNCESTAPRIGR